MAGAEETSPFMLSSEPDTGCMPLGGGRSEANHRLWFPLCHKPQTLWFPLCHKQLLLVQSVFSPFPGLPE